MNAKFPATLPACALRAATVMVDAEGPARRGRREAAVAQGRGVDLDLPA